MSVDDIWLFLAAFTSLEGRDRRIPATKSPNEPGIQVGDHNAVPLKCSKIF